MKTHIKPTRIVFPNRNWERFRLVLASSLVLLVAILTWQVSARFSASAKSNSLAANPATAIPAAAAPQAGCNNCCGSWSQKSSTGPSARDIHAVAYAQACNRVVMFGGRLATGGVPPANVTDETWEWDGNAMTWAQFTPATRPAARGQHAMAYDAARQQVVLFGGFNASFGGLNDTWVYSCATHTWTQKFPANSPPARHRHAMAYDPNSQLVVLYGGGSSFQDTWTWDGNTWTQIVGANQPGIRYEHAMAFDGTRVILFGGSKNAGFADNDTWDLTLTSPSAGTWTMIAPNGSGPNKRQRHAMAYDPGCRKVILFGGSSDVASYANDTWEWRRDTLTWCQTSVPTPPSPGREYPAMAYDGKGVIVNGGLNSGLSQIRDTWRFACNKLYTYRAGNMDNFGGSTDASWADPAFAANINTVYGNPPKRNFDDPAPDKFLLQSFTGLPANIIKAELEIRMSPDGGGSSNDSIHFDFPPFNAPSFTWGQNIRNLHPNGTWDTGQGAYTFTLDLCNLPAGAVGQPTDLLGLINSTHSLHIMVQDDTNVDYIKLRIWACPQRRYFGGLPVDSLGQAQLSEDANGNLVIGNIGASGNDGASLLFNEGLGVSMEMDDPDVNMPIGSYVQSQTVNRLGGIAGKFTLARGADGRISFTPDFSGIGAPTFHLGFYFGGAPVFTQGSLSGNTISWPASTQARDIKVECDSKKNQWKISWKPPIFGSTSLRVGGQDVGVGDTIVITAENPIMPFEPTSHVELTAAMLPTLRIGPTAVLAFEEVLPVGRLLPVQSSGLATLEPFSSGNLAVAGIGSSGQDGVSVNLGRVTGFNLDFDTLDPTGSLLGGGLRVLPTGVANNQNVSVGTLTILAKKQHNSMGKIFDDFSAVGATQQRVQIFDGNTTVSDNIYNLTTDIGIFNLPFRTGWASSGFTAVFPPSTTFMVGPVTVQGDRIQMSPVNPTIVPSYVTNVSVLGTDFPEFTITGMTTVPFCNSTITVSPGSLTVARVNQAYGQQLTAGGGLGTYRYNITSGSLNAGLSLNRLTGVISGTPTSTDPATFTVTATDDNGCTGSQQYTLTPIVCPTITVNPSNPVLPPGQVGTSYSQQFSQTGGAGFPSWTVSTGALPSGVTLNVITGLLSGNPTAAGTFNFSVTATDVNGCTGTRGYMLTIGCPAGVITVNPTSVPNGFVGTAYSQTFTATGGTGPYSFTRVTGSLPPGTTLATSGALTGTPTTEGTYNFTVQATDANGCTGTRAYTVVISGNGLMFYPLAAPVRFLDTRPGQTGCSTPGTPIAGGTSLTQAAAGFCGIPSVARAMIGNVTVVTPAANGFLTIFPSSATQPTVANTNFIAGDVLNNVFTVGLGAADGAFKIFASTTVHVVVDVTGYFAPPQPAPATGLYFHPLPSPIRLEDTRVGLSACFAPGAPLPAGVDTTHQGTTTCNGVTIPSTARAMIGNITVVTPAANGFITVFPGDAPRPLASSGNYRAAAVLNSPFMVGLSPTGQFKVYSVAQTDVVIDVSGYFSPEPVDVNGTGLLFTPIVPSRLQDTRPGQPACFNLGTPLPSGVDVTQPAAGSCTIASTARAMIGNVTVVTPAAQGFVTFWPSNIPRPLIATSNFQTSRNFNRFFTVGLGPADGAFKMFSLAMPHLVVDVSGYFAP